MQVIQHKKHDCRQSVGIRASADTQAVPAGVVFNVRTFHQFPVFDSSDLQNWLTPFSFTPEAGSVAQSSPVEILKLAARRGNVPASQVLKAALAIEKQKLPVSITASIYV